MTAMSALQDSFTTDDLATVWGNSFNSPAVGGGQCALPCIAAYSGIQSTSNYDLTGSFAYVRAVPFTPLSTGQTFLRLQASAGNWIQVGFDGGNLAAAISQASVITQGTAVTYSAASHAWWRIRESGGTLFCDYSADAITWANLWSTSHTFAITAMQAQVLSGHYGGTSSTLTNLQHANSGPYVIQANEYGSSAAFTVSYTTGSPYGFSVSASSVNNAHPGSPAAYPSIYVGNQWGNLSQGNPYPLPISGISAGQVVTTCAATLGAGGADIWDYVYDNWFNRDTNSTNNATNGLEHMIWMNNAAGVVPPGTLYASGVTLGGNTFNVYWQGSWANASQGTASFQFTTGVTSATIDMHDHIAYMVAQGWLPATWYLINVQAGFELWQGGSGLALTSFTVSDADGTSYVDYFNTTSAAPPAPSLLPVLPQITVEAGIVPDAPAGQVSTVLRLDDTTFGLLDTATLGAAITWTDISQWVLSFTITRPSTRLQGPLWNYQAGTVSIVLDNSDGRFDPDNLSGPYVSAGVTQLAPMVPVQISATFAGVTDGLYSGFADGWLPGQVTYEGGYAEITVAATDAFKVLAGVTLPTVSAEGAGALTGARITDILARAGWYGTGDRQQIAAGGITLQATTLGADALSLMQIAADTEIGQLYCSGAGAVVFRSRRQMLTDDRSAVVQGVFGDLPGTVRGAGTELAYAAVTRATDDTTLCNDVQATRVGGTLQESQDAASITRYLFRRTYARTDLIMQNDSDAAVWAEWVLYVSKGGTDRFDTLQIDPQADPANLWPQVLGREIGDRIQVWHRPAGVASPIGKDCFIAGITHTWDSATSVWLTTWTLQDASNFGSGLLTLNDAALGRLDSNFLN